MSKNYVIHSTQESRDNQTSSLLAIFETIIFVLLTWGVAVYYDTYTHIYTAIAIAPFLLLKTPESTEKAIELFLHPYRGNEKGFYKKIYLSFTLIILITLAFLISHFLSIQTYINYEGWKYFLFNTFLAIAVVNISVSIGQAFISRPIPKIGIMITLVSVIGTILGGLSIVGAMIAGVMRIYQGLGGEKRFFLKNKFLKNIVIVFFFPLFLITGFTSALTTIIKSIVIKFFTTIFYLFKHPIKTFFSISRNYREQLIVNDIFYFPELLPQISKKSNFFDIPNVLLDIKKLALHKKITLFPIIPIYTLGYFYRFSIKSTAWFFFPLAYLANLDALQNEEKKKSAVKTQTWDRLIWFNVLTAAILLIYFQFTGQYLDLLGLSDAQLSLIKEKIPQIREYFIPQAMWLLVVAVALYFVMNTFISRKEHLEDKEYSSFSYWIIKLIFVLWMVFLGWHLVVLTNQEVLPFFREVFR